MLKTGSTLVGRPFDGLTLAERLDNAGRWVALEIYSPETLPLREIAAEGASAAECAGQIAARGLDPSKYEYQLVRPPY